MYLPLPFYGKYELKISKVGLCCSIVTLHTEHVDECGFTEYVLKSLTYSHLTPQQRHGHSPNLY